MTADEEKTCPLCVTWLDQAYGELIQAIAQLGVLDTCGDLCGYAALRSCFFFPLLGRYLIPPLPRLLGAVSSTPTSRAPSATFCATTSALRSSSRYVVSPAPLRILLWAALDLSHACNPLVTPL